MPRKTPGCAPACYLTPDKFYCKFQIQKRSLENCNSRNSRENLFTWPHPTFDIHTWLLLLVRWTKFHDLFSMCYFMHYKTFCHASFHWTFTGLPFHVKKVFFKLGLFHWTQTFSNRWFKIWHYIKNFQIYFLNQIWLWKNMQDPLYFKNHLSIFLKNISLDDIKKSLD